MDVPNFTEDFRNGDLIGIADYGTGEPSRVNAAPEIASWDIAVMPGVKTESGEVVRYSAGASTARSSSTDAEREEFEFIRQVVFHRDSGRPGQTPQMTYGDEYIWNTAQLKR